MPSVTIRRQEMKKHITTAAVFVYGKRSRQSVTNVDVLSLNLICYYFYCLRLLVYKMYTIFTLATTLHVYIKEEINIEQLVFDLVIAYIQIAKINGKNI